MNLRALDLNLLVILHALLEERHVTRAARRLALSQPAASNALERCRYLFDDPLLERVAGEMRLTVKAMALQAPLAQALAAITAVVESPAQALAQKKQRVRLLMADQPGVRVLTRLLPQLQASAPLVDVVMLPWHGGHDALHRLENGEVDLALSVFPKLAAKFRRVEILRESYRVAMRREHPAAEAFDLAGWLAYPHIMVSGQGETQGELDDILAQSGKVRRVGAVVANFMMVEPLLCSSDYLALLPSLCLTPLPPQLAVFEPPLSVPGFTLDLVWHVRRENDVVVQHVAQLLRSALTDPLA